MKNNPETMSMPSGHIITLIPDVAVIVLVTSGLVWLTVENDEMDYWLAAGESLQLPAQRKVVIEADKLSSHLIVQRRSVAPEAQTRQKWSAV